MVEHTQGDDGGTSQEQDIPDMISILLICLLIVCHGYDILLTHTSTLHYLTLLLCAFLLLVDEDVVILLCYIVRMRPLCRF